MEDKNNIIKLSGKVCSGIKLSHISFNKKIYCFEVEVARSSGYTDIVPVNINEELANVAVGLEVNVGSYVTIQGEVRTANKKDENDKSHLIVYVYARDIKVNDTEIYENEVNLNGFICKKPNFRYTPLHRVISDVMLAINRNYNRSDYVPAICWGKVAKDLEMEDIVGKQISIKGRFQSRIYTKDDVNHTAYEVSVNELNIITNE